MGMRLNDPRWFRDPAQIERRIWITGATDSDIEKRRNDLELVQSLSVLSTESLLELWDVKDTAARRWKETSYWRMRCPVCGGWAYYNRSAWAGDGYFNVVPKCRDCGWPQVDQIMGSNIMVPNPRSGFRLWNKGGTF
jgi:hypothetical protein